MSVYDIVTERIIKQLEEGTIPWHKPWVAGPPPTSVATGKRYRGINVFMLSGWPYKSHYWLTSWQAKNLGGHVIAGEKSPAMVVYYQPPGGRKFPARAEYEPIEPIDPKLMQRMILLYRPVFNLEQCELPDKVVEKLQDPNEFKHEPLAEAEAIISGYKGAPRMQVGDLACYSPVMDLVTMPPKERFPKLEEYYSAAFHELGHSTGHESRLDRPGIMDAIVFGSENYSKEELIAEMTASYLNQRCGLLDSAIANSAAYLAGWIKVLKGDPKLIVQAGSAAQKAADHILGEEQQANDRLPSAQN